MLGSRSDTHIGILGSHWYMTINIAGLFSTEDMSPKDIRIETVFDEVALTGRVDEEFEDLHVSPFESSLPNKTKSLVSD
jgi:hypothetical protein